MLFGVTEHIGENNMVPSVRECKSTRVQKLTKTQKKFDVLYNSSIFFLLAFLADYLYLHFKICSATLVSSVIASDWKSMLVFRANTVVRETIYFVLESQEKWILQ